MSGAETVHRDEVTWANRPFCVYIDRVDAAPGAGRYKRRVFAVTTGGEIPVDDWLAATILNIHMPQFRNFVSDRRQEREDRAAATETEPAPDPVAQAKAPRPRTRDKTRIAIEEVRAAFAQGETEGWAWWQDGVRHMSLTYRQFAENVPSAPKHLDPIQEESAQKGFYRNLRDRHGFEIVPNAARPDAGG